LPTIIKPTDNKQSRKINGRTALSKSPVRESYPESAILKLVINPGKKPKKLLNRYVKIRTGEVYRTIGILKTMFVSGSILNRKKKNRIIISLIENIIKTETRKILFLMYNCNISGICDPRSIILLS
jgi:hypothetical protein